MLNKAIDLISKLNNNGYEAFLVGGCVRDTIMGIAPKDYDICTNALPFQIKEVFESYKTILTGERHGTITVVDNKDNFEITTYRVDGEYTDSRRPDEVIFTKSIDQDLSRRDFTINAIAWHPTKGYYDPFNGKQDINNKVLRCVGNPEDRFNEDALRIMRLARFACKYNFAIEENTWSASIELVDKIQNLSYERINVELVNILKYYDNKDLCGELLMKILEIIFPDFKTNADRHSSYILSEIGEMEKNIIARLANLFTLMSVSKLSSFPHSHITVMQSNLILNAKAYMRKLKFDNETIRKVIFVLENNFAELESRFDLLVLMNKIHTYFKKDNFEIIETLNAYYPYENIDMRTIKENYDIIMAKKEPYKISDLAINGDDLNPLFRSEMIKIILELSLQKVMMYPKLNNKEYLMEFVKRYI